MTMHNRQRDLAIAATIFAVIWTAGCGRNEAHRSGRLDSAETARGESGKSASPAESAAGAVAIPPRDSGSATSNHAGRIPVVEYHLIGNTESRYGRTRENFRKDLQLLYDRGYRPMTVAQMLDKDFSTIPAGRSPVIFTFDDASPGQFRYVERNGQLEIDSESGLGIWLEFAKRNPEWKGKATYCMLNGGAEGHNFFGDNAKFEGQKKEWRHQKVKWLADNGFELCDHTLWHAQLSKYSDEVVQEQIARNLMGIDSAVAGYRVRTFALPLGVWPKNRPLAWQGTWRDPKSGKTIRYQFDAVLEVAGGPTRSPYDPQFNPRSVTRIEIFDNVLAKVLDQLDKPGAKFVK